MRTLNPLRPRQKSAAPEPRKEREGYRKVLAVVTGRSSDQGVLTQAAELIRPSRGKLEVLYVIEMARSMPLDAEVETAAKRADAILAFTERAVHLPKDSFDANMVQARETGPAVVSEAVSRGADAVVVGMPFGKNRGVFAIDRQILYILEHAPCTVVLRRESAQDDESAMHSFSQNGAR